MKQIPIALMLAMLLLGGTVSSVYADDSYQLYYAIRYNEMSTAVNLLDQGYDANDKSPEGWPLIMVAADQNNEAMVRLLMQHGANPTQKAPDGRTAFDMTTSPKLLKMLELGEKSVHINPFKP